MGGLQRTVLLYTYRLVINDHVCLGLRKDGRAPEDCTVVFNVIMFVDAHDQPIDNSLLRGKPQEAWVFDTFVKFTT